MIVGLVSTYREGRMAASAVRSLQACADVVHVLEGPIGDAPDAGKLTDWRSFRKDQTVHVHGGLWPSDAAKRTELLGFTRRYPPPVWAVIVDGDEILMHGEYLPDLIEHVEAKDDASGETTFAFPLRIMEVDGSCAILGGRVLRADLVDAYLISSYHLLLRNGVEVSLPNEPLRFAGEPDLAPVEGESIERQRRRPLAGEPHILHRSFLRAPQRAAQRQNVAEATEFERLAAASGVVGERAAEGGVPIWLPNP